MSEPTVFRTFFKFLLDTTIREGKLDVPPKFVRDYGHLFSSRVTLEAPTGDKWRVNVLKQDHKIQLVEGWKQFSDFYCLKPGHVVVFKHDGENWSHFLVSILGCNSMEIDYPVRQRNVAGCNQTRKKKKGVQAPVEPKDEPVDDDHHPQSGPMEKGSCSRANLEQVKEEVIDILGDGPSSPIKKKPRRRLDISTEGMYIKGYKPKGRATPDVIASRSLKASVNFTSQYPYFKVMLEQMDLERNSLDIPYNFVRKLPEKKKNESTLEVGSKSWKVMLTKFASNKTGRLSTGWLPFARENGLRVGDISIFELISATKFRVTLFKGVAGQS